MTLRGLRVDGVEARADARAQADARARGKHRVGDRGVLDEQRAAAFGGFDDLLLGSALRLDERDAGLAEQVALQRDVDQIMVGEQNFHAKLQRENGE